MPPDACSCSAVYVCAAINIARAIGGENSVASRRTVQWSTTSPSLAAGTPTTDVGVAMRRSVAIANWAPAPSAGPSIAAITGTVSVAETSEHGAQVGRELTLLDAVEIGAGAERRRGAREDDDPHVVWRLRGDRRLGVEQLQQRRMVDRVAPIRADRG